MLLPLPGRLNLEHDFAVSHSFLDPVSTLAAMLFLVFLLVAAVISARRYRFASFAILWFLGGLLLESSIIGLELVFEHRLYLPSMMLLALLPLALARIVRHKVIFFSLFILPVTFLALVTYNRNIIWQDHHSLLQDCLAKSPANARVLNNLGNLYLSEGKFAAAEPLLAKAIRLRSGYLDAIYNLGNLMQRTSRFNEAIYYYQQALAADPTHINSLNNLGIIYAQQGMFPEALACLDSLIKIQPDHEVALVNRGMVLADMGRIDEAITQFRRTLLIFPESRAARQQLERAQRKKALRGQ
jgi:tetratricopeptide (TPR) repeat protein